MLRAFTRKLHANAVFAAFSMSAFCSSPSRKTRRPRERRFGLPGVSHSLCRRRAWQKVSGPAYEESAPWRDHRQRQTVQQRYQSLAVIPSPKPPAEIVLIDDVIAKGRTLIAAAMRIREACPKADIRAFALVRTMGLTLDVERLFDPCEGVVRWNGKDACREP
jgi:predicted amidophosphoribosyltransferase